MALAGACLPCRFSHLKSIVSMRACARYSNKRKFLKQRRLYADTVAERHRERGEESVSEEGRRAYARLGRSSDNAALAYKQSCRALTVIGL